MRLPEIEDSKVETDSWILCFVLTTQNSEKRRLFKKLSIHLNFWIKSTHIHWKIEFNYDKNAYVCDDTLVDVILFIDD